MFLGSMKISSKAENRMRGNQVKIATLIHVCGSDYFVELEGNQVNLAVEVEETVLDADAQ